MAERSTDPHKLVSLSPGTGRIADGQTVKRPRPPLPLATREFVYGVACAGIVLALMVAGIVRGLS